MLKVATKFCPAPEAFEQAHRAGFRFAEFWLSGKLLSNWERIATAAREFPMEYALHFPNCSKLADAEVRATQELYLALNCSALVIHEPILKQYQDILGAFDPVVRIAVENHQLTHAQWDVWANSYQWLTLDVEHLWQSTLGDELPLEAVLSHVEEFLENHGDQLAHVHLPGYLPGYEAHRPMFCSRELVYPVLSILQEHGFRGLIVSEIDRKYQTPLELRMDALCFECWRELHSQEAAGQSAQPVIPGLKSMAELLEGAIN